MSDNALVTAWKNPDARDLTTGAHPAGDIHLGSGAVLGRRARLLAGLATTANGDEIITYTMGWTGLAQ